MVPADGDGRLQFAVAHHFVECKAKPVTVTKPDPAYPRRQALELDTIARHVEPVMKMGVIGKKFLHLGIGAMNIFGIPRQGGPAKWPDTAAK